MPTLYEIGSDIAALNDLLFETGGELTDAEAEAAIDTWLAENQHQLAQKADSYCAIIQEQTALAKARAEEAKRLNALATAGMANAERMKARLKATMETAGIWRIETARFKLAVTKNGGMCPLIVPESWKADPSSAPEEFQKRTITLDTDQIRQFLVAGLDAEGCAIGERGTHLRIR